MTTTTAADQPQPVFKPCSEERYHEMLEVLPPIAWMNKGFLVGEPWTHRTCKVTGMVQPAYTAMVVRKGALGGYYESTVALTVAEWRALDVRTLTIQGGR